MWTFVHAFFHSCWFQEIIRDTQLPQWCKYLFPATNLFGIRRTCGNGHPDAYCTLLHNRLPTAGGCSREPSEAGKRTTPCQAINWFPHAPSNYSMDLVHFMLLYLSNTYCRPPVLTRNPVTWLIAGWTTGWNIIWEVSRSQPSILPNRHSVLFSWGYGGRNVKLSNYFHQVNQIVPV